MTEVDRPRAAYRVLETRATLATTGALIALAAVAWWLTAQRASSMHDMVQGLASVGNAMMPFDMSAAVFMAMWTTMMVAMMFPTVAPIVLMHRMVTRQKGDGPFASIAFVGGYLVIWTLAGLVPLVVLLVFRHTAMGAGWVAPASGIALIVAGAYQFTRWKEVCQRACRSPMTFVVTHDFGSGARGAARAGITHGLYCLGCCWALMAVLFVVGLMNLAWMAAIAVVFLAEKHWTHGLALTKVVGTAIIAIGIAVLISPSVLTSITA